jgi:hypothetical protein
MQEAERRSEVRQLPLEAVPDRLIWIGWLFERKAAVGCRVGLGWMTPLEKMREVVATTP